MPISGIAQRGIEDYIAEKLYAALLERCVTEISPSDPSRVAHVIIGKPTSERRDESVLSIMMQHPLGPSKDTEMLALGVPMDESVRPYNIPPETFGGAVHHTVVGTVWIAIREREDYADAIRIISSIFERVSATINKDRRLCPLVDDFGNTLYKLETFRSEGYETGGRQVAINHRWVDFRGLVVRSNCRDNKINRNNSKGESVWD